MLHCDFVELNMDAVKVIRETISQFTQLIRKYRRQVILMPHFTDVHRTHRHLGEVVREVIYHAAKGNAYGGDGNTFVPLGIYCYESPSCQFQNGMANACVTVDISAQWDQKREIFDTVYRSQQDVISNVMDSAEKVARFHGNDIQADYGEIFIPLTESAPLRIILV